MAKQTVEGPYRVKNFGVGGPMYEIVFMLDEEKNSFEYLRPRRCYQERRTAAYRAVALLNRRWQEEHMMDEDSEES